jgi:hypothetical protein
MLSILSDFGWGWRKIQARFQHDQLNVAIAPIAKVIPGIALSSVTITGADSGTAAGLLP